MEHVNGYVVDARDDVIEVDLCWDSYLADNGGRATAARVIGTCLFDHVAGRETQVYLATVLAKVRETGQPLQLEYRCDSPFVERHMFMEVVPEAAGRVRFHHWQTRRKAKAYPVDLGASGFAHSSIRQCSICKTVQPADAEPDAFTADLDRSMTISYTVCKACRKRLERRLNKPR